jgi:anti-anti-sigma regulatory factor
VLLPTGPLTADVTGDLAESAPVLQVELESSPTTCRLTLRGILCDSSIAALEAQVDQLGCTPCHEVVIDLRQVTRLDPVGANVIFGLYHYVVGRGGELRAMTAHDQVTATLRAVAGAEIPIDQVSGR